MALSTGCAAPHSPSTPEATPGCEGGRLARPEALLEHARGLLSRTPPVSEGTPRIGEAVASGPDPLCVVFLTTSDGGRGFTTLGRARTALEAVERASAAQRLRARLPVRWLRLDLVVRAGPSVPPDSIGSLDALGLHGLATSPAFEAALHPEEILAYRMVDETGALRPARVRDFLQRFPHRAPPSAASWEPATGDRDGEPGALPSLPVRFALRSYLGPDSAGVGVRELRRGNALDDAWRDAPAASLRASAVAAGGYLVRNVGADGRFGYNFLPKSSRFADDYNILRHAGTTYSLLELHRATGAPGFLAAAEVALGYLRRQLRRCPGEPAALCVVEGGKVKLGGNGLAILALLEHPDLAGRPDLVTDARRLGEGIVARQREDGRFEPHKWSWPGGEPDPLVSIYYPGEACLALARLAAETGEARWLEAATRGARYLMEGRDGSLADADLPHDHWLAYALREIGRLSGSEPANTASRERERERYAARMAGAILASQLRPGPDLPQPDWAGGFYRPPRSAPTSTRMEALVAILDLLPATAPASTTEPIEASLCAAADYLLRTQLLPGSALFLAEPERVLGGFRRSLTAFQLRIDTSQHAVSALLGLARLHEQGRVSCRP